MGSDIIETGGKLRDWVSWERTQHVCFREFWWSYLLNWARLDFDRVRVLFILVTTNTSAPNTNVPQLQLGHILIDGHLYHVFVCLEKIFSMTRMVG